MIDSNRIVIRPACLEDAESIAILCEQLGYGATRSQIEQRLNTLNSNEHHIIYVATLPTSEVIGWVHAHRCDLIIMPSQAIVLGLVVDENYRRCKIGQQLIKCIENWAIDKDCNAVLVRSNLLRKEAHIFYQKIGYASTKQSLVFSKSLHEP
jgi:GNAT superfamily N-acetyltransferase